MNQFFEILRQIFTLTETTKQNQDDITALQQDVRDLTQRMDDGDRRCESAIERLAYEIQRLRDELHHARQHEADQREKFQLKIENQLLKAGHRLPPAPAAQDTGDGSEA